MKDQVIREFGETTFIKHKVFITEELRRYNSSTTMLNAKCSNHFKRFSVRHLVFILQFLDLAAIAVRAIVDKKFVSCLKNNTREVVLNKIP